MAKLYFKYGAMGAAKTAELIVAAHNYTERGMRRLIITSVKDTRAPAGKVMSRVGLEAVAVSVDDSDNLQHVVADRLRLDVVLVDEVQFLTPAQIDQLAHVVDAFGVPVLCYGLRTDFKSELFPASKRLMELADVIEELKTMCHCGRKATMNARIRDGAIVRSGEQFQVGGNESYTSLCRRCYLSGDLKSKKG